MLGVIKNEEADRRMPYRWNERRDMFGRAVTSVKLKDRAGNDAVAEVGDQVVVLTPGDVCFVAGTILGFTPRRVKVGFERGGPRYYADASLMFHRKNTGVLPGRDRHHETEAVDILEKVESRLKEVAAEIKALQEIFERLRLSLQKGEGEAKDTEVVE